MNIKNDNNNLANILHFLSKTYATWSSDKHLLQVPLMHSTWAVTLLQMPL